MSKSSVRPLIFFALFWSAIVLLADFVMGRNAVLRMSSLRFQPVPCVILESKVTGSSDGKTYSADIRFRYSVDGEEFESDRVRAGSRGGGSPGPARQLIALYPAGSRTNAYFNPADPGRAVLCRGFCGNELFFALFLTPFNLIMVGLWWLIVHVRRVAKHPPLAGGAKFIKAREGTRVRLRTISPVLSAAMALGAVCFFSIFIVGFTAGEYAPLPFIGSIWMVAIGAAIWACVWRARRESSGREDLVLHTDGKRLTLPQTCGRKSNLVINRDDITGVDIQLEFDSYKKPSRFIPALVMGGGESLQLVKWSDREEAESLADWLRGELKIAPPRKTEPA